MSSVPQNSFSLHLGINGIWDFDKAALVIAASGTPVGSIDLRAGTVGVSTA